ncbi:MAG: hypothetical protein RL338_1432 [Chloroflexota bacterium]
MSNPTRTMADVRAPVVVFQVGMRINRLRSLRRWLPAFSAMPRMLRELATNPDLGMLGAKTYLSGRTIMVATYWRSFEALESYSRATDASHRPAWTAFYRRSAAGGGAVGIFHETYLVGPGAVESLYVDMPAGFGLGGAVGSIPVVGSLETARGRRDRDGSGVDAGTRAVA